MGTWQVNQARNRFSDLLNEAETHGPQIIKSHGKERAVLVSIEEYQHLTDRTPDLKAFLLGGPRIDNIDIQRNRSGFRRVRL